MADKPRSRLLEWLQRRRADDLRVVGWYSETDHEWLYRREDVAATYEEADFDASIETYREIEPLVARQAEIIDAGDLRATVNVYDDIVLIQFPLGSGEGMVVSLDAAVGEDIVEIVANGLQLLLADVEDVEERMPEWMGEVDP